MFKSDLGKDKHTSPGDHLTPLWNTVSQSNLHIRLLNEDVVQFYR